MSIVYHYCSSFNALAILKEHRFRLTDIYRMNDVKEARYLYSLYLHELKNYRSSDYMDEFYEFAMSHNYSFYTKYLTKVDGRFVGCFSKEVDLASQWIAYGNQGQGYAIGVDEEAFKELEQSNQFKYDSIRYYSPDTIKDKIEQLYDKFHDSIQANPRSTQVLDEILMEIKNTNVDSNLIKSYHYKSEQEKRLIYLGMEPGFTSDHFKIIQKDYYAKENYIVAYMGLYFDPSLIKEVIIGPRNRNEVNDIEELLEDLGYNNVKVVKSNSGYI